jgi:hypothetical protein
MRRYPNIIDPISGTEFKPNLLLSTKNIIRGEGEEGNGRGEKRGRGGGGRKGATVPGVYLPFPGPVSPLL